MLIYLFLLQKTAGPRDKNVMAQKMVQKSQYSLYNNSNVYSLTSLEPHEERESGEMEECKRLKKA